MNFVCWLERGVRRVSTFQTSLVTRVVKIGNVKLQVEESTLMNNVMRCISVTLMVMMRSGMSYWWGG